MAIYKKLHSLNPSLFKRFISFLKVFFKPNTDSETNLKSLNMAADKDNSFAIVAIRCNSDDSVGKRKLIAGHIYYLLDGYNLDANTPEVICQKRKNLNSIFDEYFTQYSKCQPHVVISAIVGQNGSGKSSLVEFMMRLINNFCAVTFGEDDGDEVSCRLHFIDGVDGDLWFISNQALYQLEVKNSKVGLYLIKKPECHCFNIERISEVGDESVRGYENLIKGKSKEYLFKIFSPFFYTVVSNYSIYSYNINDYKEEWDAKKKNASDDSRCWLEGLFHKNDGYQKPLVIAPLRNEGNIDINSENSLARERLIALLIKRKDLRKINKHLIADGIRCYFYGKKEKDYGINALREHLGLKDLNDSTYDRISKQIVKLWSSKVQVDFTSYDDKTYYKQALEYLVYKTLKISKNYRQHHHNYDLLAKSDDYYNPTIITDIVESISMDFSHITRKIYQTIAYIIFKIYPIYEKSDKLYQDFSFMDIYFNYNPLETNAVFHIVEHISSNYKVMLLQQALFPPPFLKCNILLHEEGQDEKKINFESLSSGEKQQIFAVSTILYHLDNIESVKEDQSDPYRIKYKRVLLILEEIELYFHPELQQGFIKFLLDGIMKMNLKNIEGIHILLITHSPYVLSDIPRNNVLALKDNGRTSLKALSTFCGNIHEMLKDSFFLSHGSQGFFAQWEIGFLMACLKIHKEYRSTHQNLENGATNASVCEESTNLNKWNQFLLDMLQDSSSIYGFTDKYVKHHVGTVSFDYQAYNDDYPEAYLQERIEIIDEPIVRNILQRELNNAFSKTEEEILRMEIAERQKKINQLKRSN